jgi:hypothetical protein
VLRDSERPNHESRSDVTDVVKITNRIGAAMMISAAMVISIDNSTAAIPPSGLHVIATAPQCGALCVYIKKILHTYTLADAQSRRESFATSRGVDPEGQPQQTRATSLRVVLWTSACGPLDICVWIAVAVAVACAGTVAVNRGLMAAEVENATRCGSRQITRSRRCKRGKRCVHWRDSRFQQ